eukprot:TRINITY_DN538_c0_g1_i7.p1 TRINITY_DN538_c0_g1~~TRINITY_DN538_c0_g1_i7.p1  ORF type:complete len:938 (+),score=243.88 TRINITY_DN538_c0_g1_i7:665-3478(+)
MSTLDQFWASAALPPLPSLRDSPFSAFSQAEASFASSSEDVRVRAAELRQGKLSPSMTTVRFSNVEKKEMEPVVEARGRCVRQLKLHKKEVDTVLDTIDLQAATVAIETLLASCSRLLEDVETAALTHPSPSPSPSASFAPSPCSSDSCRKQLTEWHAVIESKLSSLSSSTDQSIAALAAALTPLQNFEVGEIMSKVPPTKPLTTQLLSHLIDERQHQLNVEAEMSISFPYEMVSSCCQWMLDRLNDRLSLLASIVSFQERARLLVKSLPLPEGVTASEVYSSYVATKKQLVPLRKKLQAIEMALLEDEDEDVDEVEVEELLKQKRETIAKRKEIAQSIQGNALSVLGLRLYPELFVYRPEMNMEYLVESDGLYNSSLQLSDYEIEKKFGPSRHVVSLCSRGGVQYVVKCYNTLSGDGGAKALMKEARLLSRCSHPNLGEINHLFFAIPHSFAYIEMPYYAGGTIAEWVMREKPSELQLQMAFEQILRGISYLHAYGVIHCDVKPANVVMDISSGSAVARLLDFDVSKTMSGRIAAAALTATMTSAAGTMLYLAPECHDRTRVSPKVDVYAMGLLMFDISFPGQGTVRAQELYRGKTELPFPTETDTALKEVIELMTESDPKLRLPAMSCLAHSYFVASLMATKEKKLTEIRKQKEREVALRKTESALLTKTDRLDVETKSLEQHFGSIVKPPPRWSTTSLLDLSIRREDVTKRWREKFQKMFNSNTFSEELGKGRDSNGGSHKGLKIVKIERIENSWLWKRYQSAKHSISLLRSASSLSSIDFALSEPWMKSDLNLDNDRNEVFLLHGTSKEVTEIVIKQGFDERVGNLGGMFGSGVYFAENPCKSDQYIALDEKPCHIFLSRVVLGSPFHTKKSHRNVRRVPKDGCDSLVAESNWHSGRRDCKLHRYREFVVYDRAQCYPEFLIQFERVATANPQ